MPFKDDGMVGIKCGITLCNVKHQRAVLKLLLNIMHYDWITLEIGMSELF